MSWFRELRELARYRWRTPAKAKDIVLYAEHAGYYAYFEGLIAELTGTYGQPVSYVTSDPDDPILKKPPDKLHPFLLRRLLPYFMIGVNCRVFVMTLTDLHQFHLKRSWNPVHYVYLFHSLVSSHMMYRKDAFEFYDSILCVGPHHVRELDRYFARKENEDVRLVEAGYYRLERIYQSYRKMALPNDRSTAKTILIAPSWGEQNLLKECGQELLQILLDNGYRVILRPHPETLRRDPNLVARLIVEFEGRPGFSFEDSVATDDSLLEADLMICDLSGVALEYALGTERPVLFFDLPPKIKNEDYRELGLEPVELAWRSDLGEIISPANLADLPATVERLLNDRPRYGKTLAERREQLVFNFGESAAVGAAYIMNLLEAATEIPGADCE